MNRDVDAEIRMNDARRKFLAACGRFAVATPPAMVVLLAASRQDYATAASGAGFPIGGGGTSVPRGPQGNNGFGNGGDDGVPGNSDFRDSRR